MKNLKRYGLLIIIFISIFTKFANADIPKKIYYQGRLTDSSKNPLSGSYNFTFEIYDVATGGTALWNETHNGVIVNAGVFSVELGDTTPINLAFDKQYYLQITVGGETFSPRRPLLTSAYSFRAAIAESVTNNSITSSMIIDGTVASNDLANNSITSAKIVNNAVTSSKIQDGTITSNDLANNSITGAKIVDNAVTSSKIANNSINDDKISAVGWSKVTNKPAGFADGTDDTLNGTSAGGDLTGTYPNPTIANDKINSAKILDNSIISNDIRTNAISTFNISKGVITFATQYEASGETSTTVTGDPGFEVAGVTFTLPQGNYLLYINFTGEGHPSSGYSMYIRIAIDSETSPLRYERYNVDSYDIVCQNRIASITSDGSSAHSVKIYMQSNNSAGTAYIRGRRLTVLAIKW